MPTFTLVFSPIPGSRSEAHIRVNLAARGLTLDDEDRARIAATDETHRCEDPEWMPWWDSPVSSDVGHGTRRGQ